MTCTCALAVADNRFGASERLVVHELRSSSYARTKALQIAVWCVLVLAACSQEPNAPVDAAVPGCVGAVCPSSAPAIDWSAPNPTFMAHLRVTDPLGNPVEGATVSAGALQGASDGAGRVRVGPLSALSDAVVRIERTGMAPQFVSISALRAARTTESVIMTPLSVSSMVSAQKRILLEASGSIDLPARSLATSDGVRASSAKVEMSYVSASARERLPGRVHGIDQLGSPTLLDPMGVLFVRFRDSASRPLNLAPGSAATLSFPVAPDSSLRDGQAVPLWSLDETSGQWRKESKCRVVARSVGSAVERACVGVVDHFSYWAMAQEIDIYKPDSVGCVNATVAREANACFDLRPVAMHHYRCNAQGEQCSPYVPGMEKFIPHAPDVAWCAVLPTRDVSYRVQVIYDVTTERCGADGPKPGRRAKVSTPLTLTNFQTMLGSDLMLNFTVRGDRDCGTLCAQIPLTVTLADLAGPLWTDHDEDGFFTIPAGTLETGLARDCNDTRADIYPRRETEPFCVAEDLNCDGRAPPVYVPGATLPPWVWNQDCKVCRERLGEKLMLSEEVSGNDYDEDCSDGALDRDADGVLPPDDCDDGDKGVNPSAVEVVGNSVDENCDGMALDADGDGYFYAHQVVHAEKLALDPSKFIDCDDYDEQVHPGVPASEEAVLRQFYYQASGTTRRSLWFCGYFEQQGIPSWLYRRSVRDLNCDGRATDLDGDGFTSPDDLTFGPARATDCDDLDPRNRPNSELDPTCVVRADHPNDSTCDVLSRANGAGCPILTLSGTDLVTTCEESRRNGVGTGMGGCTFAGWSERNPLSINPGTTWGPCDGTGPLPECPMGSSCFGTLTYTPELTAYLQSTYLPAEQTLAFLGMCFPSCALPTK
jgi:hypothetical protein